MPRRAARFILPLGLTAVLALSLTSCLYFSVEQPTGPIEHVELSRVADGAYYQRFRDSLSVREVGVVVRDHRIVDVQLLRFAQGCKCLPHAKRLRKKVLAQQTAHIDAVSGATRHTYSMLKAIEIALKKGIKPDVPPAS